MSPLDWWTPFYGGRYLADTKHLDLAHHGAYLLLLIQYWAKGPLPDDDADLARIVGTDLRNWRKNIAPKLLPFFTKKDGRLHQKRADMELARQADISSKRSAASRSRRSIAGANDPSNDPPNGGSRARSNDPPNGGPNGQHTVHLTKSLNSNLREGSRACEGGEQPSAVADPVGPENTQAIVLSLQKSHRMKAYPPRAAVLTPEQQRVAVAPEPPPAPKTSYLPRATLDAMPHRQIALRKTA